MLKQARWLSMILCIALILSCLSAPALAAKKDKKPEVFPPSGNLTFEDAITRELNVTIDGEPLKVTEYEDFYLAEPLSTEQRVSIYVPETATKDSPVILCVNNSGWMANSYASCTKVNKDDDATVGEYSAHDDGDKVGMILSKGYVMVSYGARGRNDKPGDDGLYKGHSPATVADTKAVIRYLRLNDALLPAGDLDRITVTGTSGGGALSTLIAASGDSTDFFPELCAIGAAGIEQEGDGYVSTLSDAVYAVIAYCPITDLPHADMAYEWTYKDVRAALEDIDFNADSEGKPVMNYTVEDHTVNPEISEYLAGLYAEYVDGLGLTLDDGTPLTSANLRVATAQLMEAEIVESIREIGAEQMMADIDGISKNEKDGLGAKDWLIVGDDDSFTYDYEKRITWVAANNKLKIVCAFSNKGLWGPMNEDTLFGTADNEYCAFEPYSWDHDSVEGNGCGLDDTGTKATHWYVRYGMNDRDSSFALETLLRYSIYDCEAITDRSFEFAWLKPHAGDYDVTEAYAWLDEALEEGK